MSSTDEAKADPDAAQDADDQAAAVDQAPPEVNGVVQQAGAGIVPGIVQVKTEPGTESSSHGNRVNPFGDPSMKRSKIFCALKIPTLWLPINVKFLFVQSLVNPWRVSIHWKDQRHWTW